MDGYCTCGAKLAEDALFCHRCGRPLRELVGPEAAETPAPAAEPEPREPAAERVLSDFNVGFRNGAAVRAGFVAAASVQLVSTLSAAVGAALLMPVVLIGGGLYAVILYARRTGIRLSVLDGARMGWITGVFSFAFSVFFAAMMALLSGGDQIVKAIRESSSLVSLSPAEARKLEQLVADPAALAIFFALVLLLQFVVSTVLCSMGGALGAKVRGQKAGQS